MIFLHGFTVILGAFPPPAGTGLSASIPREGPALPAGFPLQSLARKNFAKILRSATLWRCLLLFCAAAALPALPRSEGGSAPPAPAAGLYGISPGPGDSRVFTDVLGRRLAAEGAFRRIVSLSPGVTEILFALGAGGQTLGITQYCDWPPEAQGLTRVGGFSGATVSTDQIAALRPDLVILSGEMHGRIIGLLDSLGIPSFAVEPRNFAGVYETIAVIGELCGRGEEAAAVVNEMKAKIAGAAEKFRGREKPAVFWLLGEDPLMSVGGRTFVSEALSLGGGRNIFEELDEQWPLVSAEQVLLRRPAWILTGDDMGTPDPAALVRRPGWGEIPAIREGRIAPVDADLLYRYGPRLADGVLAVAELLHGEGGPR
jgi:iron complex transport system substrate-binding protein